MRTIVVGNGQIGSSLVEVLRPIYDVTVIDIGQEAEGNFEVLHVAFPPSDTFGIDVIGYYNKYNPDYVVIHSTVPVGTTEKLGKVIPNIVHSPVEGRHPKLTESIKIFGKFIGGESIDVVMVICDYFNKAGIKAKPVVGSKNTELGKIMSTTRLGWDVVFMKEVAKLCAKYGCDFEEVYTNYTKNYNQGYADMDQAAFSKFHRPVLANMPGKVGGHCVMANIELIDSFVADIIKEKNKTYENDSVL